MVIGVRKKNWSSLLGLLVKIKCRKKNWSEVVSENTQIEIFFTKPSLLGHNFSKTTFEAQPHVY